MEGGRESVCSVQWWKCFILLKVERNSPILSHSLTQIYREREWNLFVWFLSLQQKMIHPQKKTPTKHPPLSLSQSLSLYTRINVLQRLQKREIERGGWSDVVLQHRAEGEVGGWEGQVVLCRMRDLSLSLSLFFCRVSALCRWLRPNFLSPSISISVLCLTWRVGLRITGLITGSRKGKSMARFRIYKWHWGSK